jgi:hypothetical protein
MHGAGRSASSGSRWGRGAVSVVEQTTRQGRPLIVRGSDRLSRDRSPGGVPLGLGSRWGRGAVSVVEQTTRQGRPLIVRGSDRLSRDRSPRPVRGRGSLRFRRPLARHALRPPPELPRETTAHPARGADPGAGRGIAGSRRRAQWAGTVGEHSGRRRGGRGRGVKSGALSDEEMAERSPIQRALAGARSTRGAPPDMPKPRKHERSGSRDVPWVRKHERSGSRDVPWVRKHERLGSRDVPWGRKHGRSGSRDVPWVRKHERSGSRDVPWTRKLERSPLGDVP